MFVRAISKEMQNFLISKFELGTAKANGICSNYLAEDQNVVAHRTELEVQEKRLVAIQRELDSFGLY